MTHIRDVGEFGLIGRLARLVPVDPRVVQGIGDDCAVLRVGDRMLLASTDMFVEGVHFLLEHAAPQQIGWKAAAAALSDIAAMGGKPLFGLLSVSLPAQMQAEFAEDCFRGVCDAFTAQGAVIVGGDTTRSPDRFVLDVTVLGEAVGGRFCTRAGARPGDLIAVTGWPGRSAAGLRAIVGRLDAPSLIERHYRPEPRVREGQWLAAHDALHALIDVSDGLAQDVGHLACAAGLCACIDSARLPAAPDLAAFADARGLSPHPFILGGGEDYELAMALAPGDVEGLAEAFAREFNLPLTVVGAFAEGEEGVWVDGEPLADMGFDHFAG